ncbi:MAG TPA: efflux RND transporter periplasmic adaptor subunit [Bryobacteraceae bacterium]|nr:efflux RND transporter periplasmic adaptor subunit [Bryobacteraceae bacterium]
MEQSSYKIVGIAAVAVAAAGLAACSRNGRAEAVAPMANITVGVTKAARMPLDRELTLSSELVPFQEIDVYAKESGYVRQLDVDYGTRVKAGQLMAVLEIPELQAQLEQDKAAIKNMTEQVTHAEHELNRVEAQHKVVHLQYDRLKSVSDAKPGLVAQQEVDDWQGKDLALEAQVEASKSGLQSAQSELAAAQAKLVHDQALYSYARITAPFAGVVTQRYANYGTLMQAGTGSSTQAMPLVKLSQDDLFRLVIPVPESAVRYIHVGDPVMVRIPSLGRSFPAKVARSAADVNAETRTMHTEVDVPNPHHVLIEGMYAEATLELERKNDALVVPMQAVDHQGNRTTVMVVNPQNRIEERDATLGVQSAGYAEVLSGVAEGDRLVVSDRGALRPGEIVQPKTIDLLNFQSKSNPEN